MRFSFAPGSTPLDGFTIEQGLGIGGFGEVYRAVSDVGKRVALKKIQRNIDIELRGVKQCINLNHVNLISLWDIRIDVHGESWVVMEYVPGPSLRDIVHAHPNGLAEDEVKRWFVSTASGVAYLHQQDIVHRDLKPGNIFLDEETHVIKIGDYGLSKFMNNSRRSGQTESVGTFHYMAPEIGRGVYGREIDIYALGIILFEILTGDVPFDGESTQEIIMKHLTDDPKLDRVPAGYRKAIRVALQKDPELRYHSVPEMLADLPWPDIAESCQKIILHNSIGPLVGSSGKSVSTGVLSNAPYETPDPHEITHDHLSQIAGKQPGTVADVISDIDVQVIEVVGGADIVFGPLKDLSQAGSESGRPHSASSAKARQPLARLAEAPRDVRSPVGQNGALPQPQPFGESIQSSPLRTNLPDVATTAPLSSIASPRASTGALIRVPIPEIEYEAAAKSPMAGTLQRRINEPIARSLMQFMQELGHWWTYGNVSTPVKVVLLVAVSVALVLNSAWLLPMAMGLGLVYLVYYVLRTWWLQESDSDYGHGKPNKRELKKIVLEHLRIGLRSRPTSQRFVELIGSLVVAAIACGVLSLLGLALGGSALLGSENLWRAYGWMTLTSGLASWLLLMISKFWEDRPGETMMRRFTMIVMGVVIGAFSFWTANSLSVSLSQGAELGTSVGLESALAIKGMPILPASLIFYAGLFGILRWWMLADPVRPTRLSILRVSFCLIWACLLSVLLDLPVLPNCILAVVISSAVQLAAPWWSAAEVRTVSQ